jgi:capsular polysaccharide biosynthesis protein
MEIKKYIQLVLKRLWFIILVPVVVGAITGYMNFFVLKPVYEAETTLLITGLSSSGQEEDVSALRLEDIAAGQVLIYEYSAIISSNRVTDAVLQKLNDPDLTHDALRDMMSIRAVNDTRIIAITVTHNNAVKAAQIADVLAEEFSQIVVELYRIENVDIIDKAQVPTSPVGPAKVRNTVLAAFAAGMFAVGLVILLDFLNTKIKTSEDVETYLGLSVLGSIPVNVLDKERSK